MQDGFIQLGFLAIAVIANGRGVYDAGAVGIVEKFIGLVLFFLLPCCLPYLPSVPKTMVQVI